MAIYAIGDIQGCFDSLMLALDKINFSEKTDKIFFLGDLVNRGPRSLETLRFIKNLGNSAFSILGNHDLHLLAQVFKKDYKDSKNDTLQEIFNAPDKIDLIDWLRNCPLFYHDESRKIAFVHAGIFPLWSIKETSSYANEVESVIQGNSSQKFFLNMYGNEPSVWSENLSGLDRLRFITNCLTRIRFCKMSAELDFEEKGAPGSQKNNDLIPWFKHPKRCQNDTRIIFGHWSTLGYFNDFNVWGIDSGCCWGGKLTILKINNNKLQPIFSNC